MAVQVPSSIAPTTADLPERFRGRKDVVVYFLDSVANGDTLSTGLANAGQFAVYGGTAALLATHSSGDFTFTVTSGPSLNVRLIIWIPK